VVNLADENLNSLPEIAEAAKVAARVLDDFRDHPDRYCRDLCGPQALDDYYCYYFFERQKEMSYQVSKAELGLDDTLLNLLSGNTKAVNDYGRKHGGVSPPLFYKQAFSTAADAFKAIDTPTEGIVVPFGTKGQELINQLCSAFEVEKQFELLKRAQQFTVNVFPQVMQALKTANAVHPVRDDVGILHLNSRYYSNEYGLVMEQLVEMELLDA
jgi:CRISPR-associated endonuclease/helicase Cas3